MSWNTWLASMTKMENLSDGTLLKMRDKLSEMMAGYAEDNFGGGGALQRYSMREYEKCREQMDRVETEMRRRGLS
jgi:hypothetical protein